MSVEPSKMNGNRWLLAISVLILAAVACEVQLTDATATPGPTGTVCDDAQFVSDVTVPDGTTVKAGAQFTKTWRIRNAGTCPWSAGYRLSFVGGTTMGGTSAALGKTVPPGGETDISVVLTAPNANGLFRSDWRMHNASNLAFGSSIFVSVRVSDAATTPPPVTGCAAGNYRVSGNLNVTDGVTFAFSGATSVPSVVFVEQGYYFCVPSGWSGTWTPAKGAPGNWSFSPASYSATVTTDLSGYHFVGTPLIATTAAP